MPLRNSVTVARQTLTLFVGVRIPIPQPKITVHPLGWAVIFLLYNIGIRTRREKANGFRKKTVRWTVFAAVGNERSEAKHTVVRAKSLFLSQKKRLVSASRFFNEIRLTASEILLRDMK